MAQDSTGARATPRPSVAADDKGVSKYGKCKSLVVKHFLPLSFAVAIAIALAWPAPGKFLVEIKVTHEVRVVQTINMIIVFFISGLVLKTEDLKKAWAHKLGVVYGFVAIILVTPMLGYLFNEIPLQPKEFAIGLTIFSVAPTTLGVGMALVHSCKGNEGLALFLTVGTNLLGVLTMPFVLKLLLHSVAGVAIKVQLVDLFVKLLITILVPSVIGKTLRELSPAVQRFAKEHRTALSITNTSNLAFIIWQNLSGAQHMLLKQSFLKILIIILLAIGQHLLYLAFNYIVLCYILQISYPEAVATTVMSSQKSAPVAITVITNVAKGTAAMGLLVIPCVVGQIVQIFVGSAFAPWFARQVDKREAALEAHIKSKELGEVVTAASKDTAVAKQAEPASTLADPPAVVVKGTSSPH